MDSLARLLFTRGLPVFPHSSNGGTTMKKAPEMHVFPVRKIPDSVSNPAAKLLVVFMLSVLFLSGCGLIFPFAPKKVQPPKVTVAPGTEVPFSKVMTPGFAEEYVGADIVTEAEFFASGMGAFNTKIPKGYIIFQAVPPGEQGKTDPLSGQAAGEYVLIRKADAGLIFELKRGDPIILRGGTEVVKAMGSYVDKIKFIATSVEIKSTTDAPEEIENKPDDRGRESDTAQSGAIEVPIGIENDLKWIQESLNELDYDCGSADGIMGSKTRRCIEAFQKDNFLEATGEADRMTAERIYKLLHEG